MREHIFLMVLGTEPFGLDEKNIFISTVSKLGIFQKQHFVFCKQSNKADDGFGNRWCVYLDLFRSCVSILFLTSPPTDALKTTKAHPISDGFCLSLGWSGEVPQDQKAEAPTESHYVVPSGPVGRTCSFSR